MDRISELPESIVHHILSFVNTSVRGPAELVRMSVLNKKWFDLTASFPILEFNCFDIDLACRERLFKCVEYRTSRFYHQSVTAQEFKLTTSLREPIEIDTVNECLELVIQNGVRLLEIEITRSLNSPMPKYCLPNTLLSVSVLKSLTLQRCELPSSLLVDAVKFKSLIQLTLGNVSVDDEVITYLTTSCPLLQELHIMDCYGLKRFCVHGHQHLQEVWIFYLDTPVERIDIEAPNLSTLFVGDWGETGAPRMNVASCKKLTTVSYYGHPLPNSNCFSYFLSNFPFIENFYLSTKYECNNLKLSSYSLRTLVLHLDHDLEEIEFNTPNLIVFIYSRHVNMFFNTDTKDLLLRDSTHMKACMQCYTFGYNIDALWFHKLRLFLGKKSGFKVLNLFVDVAEENRIFRELEELKAIELPPYELENVELQLHQESLDYVAFVEAILWCCRPQTLIISYPHSYIDFQSDFIKFVCEKLLQQEDEGHTKIQIVLPYSSLLKASRPKGKVISFIKEEAETPAET